jgi:hypothetical protein
VVESVFDSAIHVFLTPTLLLHNKHLPIYITDLLKPLHIVAPQASPLHITHSLNLRQVYNVPTDLHLTLGAILGDPKNQAFSFLLLPSRTPHL